MKSPYLWDTQEVAAFIYTLGIPAASSNALVHSIQGRDLMELSEAEIRNDLGLERVHERKYLIRALQDIKNGCVWFVKVISAKGALRIRFDSPNNYTFESLNKDVSRLLGLNYKESSILDSQGNCWGETDLSIVFDSKADQKERLYYSHPSAPIEFDKDWSSVDFEKDNPHRKCIGVGHNSDSDIEESKSKELCYPSHDSSIISGMSFV
jgi:hypothetical protein